MAQSAVSWLHTFLPMLDMGSPPSELKRAGNEHRQFIPVNAYQTKDGYIYMAIGSDAQWHRFVRQSMFAPLDEKRYATNEGRRKDKKELHASIEALTKKHTSQEISQSLKAAAIPHSPITPIEEVAELPFVSAAALKTRSPEGKTVRLPPPAVMTGHLEKSSRTLPFAPAYGEHTETLLAEIGLSASEISSLKDRGVVA